MEYRSTNAGQHLSNNVVAGVGSSHGVEIGTHPTSTGACLQSVGDDTDISLNLFAKGAGAVVLGNSSNPLTLGNGSTLVTIGTTGGQVRIGGSTAPFYGFIRMTSTTISTPAALNSTNNGIVADSTVVFTGVTSSHFITAQSVNLPAGVAIAGAWAGDTAGDVHVQYVKGSSVAVAASTHTVTLLAFRF